MDLGDFCLPSDSATPPPRYCCPFEMINMGADRLSFKVFSISFGFNPAAEALWECRGVGDFALHFHPFCTDSLFSRFEGGDGDGNVRVVEPVYFHRGDTSLGQLPFVASTTALSSADCFSSLSSL